MRERCHALTKRRGLNRRCKHDTVHGIFCWQHQKTERGLRITDSTLPGAGDGLFTTRPIKKGALICYYTGDEVVETDPDYENPYALEIRESPPTFIDASKTNEPGEGRWVNDGRGKKPPNAELEYVEEDNMATITAIRDIDPGEEILVDYGREYPWREPTQKTARSFSRKEVVPKKRVVPKEQLPRPAPKKRLVKPAYDPKWDEAPVFEQQKPWLLPPEQPEPAPMLQSLSLQRPKEKQGNARISPPEKQEKPRLFPAVSSRLTWSQEEKEELELLSILMALQDLFEDEKLAQRLKIPLSKHEVRFPKRDPKKPERYNSALLKQMKKEREAWIKLVNKNPRNAMTVERANEILKKASKIKAAEIRKAVAAKRTKT